MIENEQSLFQLKLNENQDVTLMDIIEIYYYFNFHVLFVLNDAFLSFFIYC